MFPVLGMSVMKLFLSAVMSGVTFVCVTHLAHCRPFMNWRNNNNIKKDMNIKNSRLVLSFSPPRLLAWHYPESLLTQQSHTRVLRPLWGPTWATDDDCECMTKVSPAHRVMEDTNDNITSPRTSHDLHTVTSVHGSSRLCDKVNTRHCILLLLHPYNHPQLWLVTSIHTTLGMSTAALGQQQQQQQR